MNAALAILHDEIGAAGARNILDALREAGFVLVPITPERAAIQTGIEAMLTGNTGRVNVAEAYRAMVLVGRVEA